MTDAPPPTAELPTSRGADDDSRRCPICAGALRGTGVRARDRLVTGDGPFTVLECVSCAYGLTLPQLGDGELARYYAEEYYEGFYEHSAAVSGKPLHALRERFRRWSARRRHGRRPYRLSGVPVGRMLDVGCGGGELLAHFAARGWAPYGVDPSAAATAAAARRGATVHLGTLRDHPWEPGSFDLVTFEHSLEHIVDPLAALTRARALLRPGGLLLVSAPNWSCWQRRWLFGDRWFPLDVPRHQQHFSPRALRRVADELGLRARDVGTTSTVIAAAYSVHYLIAGRWSPGWKLWLSYALGMAAAPFVFLVDHVGGGDCCFAVLEAPPAAGAPDGSRALPAG